MADNSLQNSDLKVFSRKFTEAGINRMVSDSAESTAILSERSRNERQQKCRKKLNISINREDDHHLCTRLGHTLTEVQRDFTHINNMVHWNWKQFL